MPTHVQKIITALAAAGVHGPGMPDAMSRALAHFGDEGELDDTQLTAWAAGLRDSAGHLFPKVETPTIPALSLHERLTRGRPAPPEKWQPAHASPEQQTQLALIQNPGSRLTMFREMQAAAAKK